MGSFIVLQTLTIVDKQLFTPFFPSCGVLIEKYQTTSREFYCDYLPHLNVTEDIYVAYFVNKIMYLYSLNKWITIEINVILIYSFHHLRRDE